MKIFASRHPQSRVEIKSRVYSFPDDPAQKLAEMGPQKDPAPCCK